MKLALTLPIEAQETLTSYVSRIAALNGSYYVQDFCVDMRLDWRGILKGDQKSINMIADLVGTDMITLLQNSIRSMGGGGYLFGNEILTKKLLRRRDVFICADCLCEDMGRDEYMAYKRIIWDLDTVQACPDHSRLLVELPRPKYPRDGQDCFGNVTDNMNFLSQMPKSEQIKTTAFAHYQQQRLAGKITQRTWLDKLDFDVAISFAMNLGLLSLYGPNVKVADLSVPQRHSAGETGYAICRQGPKAIAQCLENIRLNSHSPKGGFYPDFGFFIRWLQSVNGQDRHKPVIDLVRNFIFDHYAIEVGGDILGIPCQQQAHYTWQQVSHQRNIPSSRVYSLRNAIAGYVYKKQFPKGMFEAEFNAIANDLERKEAAMYLNLHSQQFDGLLTANLIQSSLDLPKVRTLYSKQELDKFLNSLNVRQKIFFEQNGLLSLTATCRRLKVEFIALIKLLQSGQLKQSAWIENTHDMASLRVDPCEIEVLISPPDPQGYNILALKSRLRISASTATYLIKKKLIASSPYSHPRTGKKSTLVQEEDVQCFLEEHATLGLLAHEIGTQAKHVSSRLDKQGIYQIPFPEHLSMIYRRNDLPHDLR